MATENLSTGWRALSTPPPRNRPLLLWSAGGPRIGYIADRGQWRKHRNDAPSDPPRFWAPITRPEPQP